MCLWFYCLQLLEKDGEIRYLTYKLDEARAAASALESRLESAEVYSVSLADNITSERSERSKAQVALADKASALAVCTEHTNELSMEVERCGHELVGIQHQSRQSYAAGSRH